MKGADTKAKRLFRWAMSELPFLGTILLWDLHFRGPSAITAESIAGLLSTTVLSVASQGNIDTMIMEYQNRHLDDLEFQKNFISPEEYKKKLNYLVIKVQTLTILNSMASVGTAALLTAAAEHHNIKYIAGSLIVYGIYIGIGWGHHARETLKKGGTWKDAFDVRGLFKKEKPKEGVFATLSCQMMFQ
jgi:hypothetical protein